MVLGALTYPLSAQKIGGQGAVTLAGTLTRDGGVRGAHVVETNVSPPEARAILEKEALKNFTQWRADAGPREQPIQVTFKFVIDDSIPLGLGGVSRTELALPGQVVIRQRVH